MNKAISIFLSVICITGLVGYGSNKNAALTSASVSKSVEQSKNISANQPSNNNKASDKSLLTTINNTQTTNPYKVILTSLNSTYKIENVSIKLINGKSIMEIVPGSASKLITTVWKQPVVGDLNGDKINDAALILIQNGGGSGTFYYVAANISTKR